MGVLPCLKAALQAHQAIAVELKQLQVLSGTQAGPDPSTWADCSLALLSGSCYAMTQLPPDSSLWKVKSILL
jgi:hypothetical protein